MEEKMKDFLTLVGLIAGNFIAWWLISFLPARPVIIMVLALASGFLMLLGGMYFMGPVDKGKTAQSKS